MRAEFFRPDDPEGVVGVAVWNGASASIDAENDQDREVLERIFRPSPVQVTAPSMSPGGRIQEVVVEPGDLEWFRMAAMTRAEGEGLAVRFVTDRPGGWDPAGTYRSMRAWVAARETGQPE
jgi:hypothetical protein